MIEIVESDEGLIIKDRFSTLEDYLRFREAVGENLEAGAKSLNVIFMDAQVLSSSVFGLLLKIKNIDGVDVSISVSQRNLYKQIEYLDLLEFFSVERYRA